MLLYPPESKPDLARALRQNLTAVQSPDTTDPLSRMDGTLRIFYSIGRISYWINLLP